MDFLIVLVVLVVVVYVVTGPLRQDRAQPDAAAATADADLAELEAEREAKYREIRDAELDHETGKLSDADFAALDRTLRAQAVEIMHAIDRTGGTTPASPAQPASDPRADSE